MWVLNKKSLNCNANIIFLFMYLFIYVFIYLCIYLIGLKGTSVNSYRIALEPQSRKDSSCFRDSKAIFTFVASERAATTCKGEAIDCFLPWTFQKTFHYKAHSSSSGDWTSGKAPQQAELQQGFADDMEAVQSSKRLVRCSQVGCMVPTATDAQKEGDRQREGERQGQRGCSSLRLGTLATLCLVIVGGSCWWWRYPSTCLHGSLHGIRQGEGGGAPCGTTILREYGTSERLQNHLTYSSRCAALIKRHLEPVPLRPGRNNTRRDRDPPLAIPVLQTEGPCRLWNTEDGENDEEGIDLELIEQLMDVLERNFERDPEKVADITIAELVTHYKNALCTTWADFGTVRHTVKRFREEALQDADDRDIRAMSLVQDLLRLRWFFTDEDLEKLEVDLPDASLRENAWRYCQAAKKSPSWNVKAFKPSIIFRDFVIVHLFSGERRENDLESYLNQIEAPKNSIKVILSVDIIYDHQRANLANGSVQRQWINFILNGLIAILYVGPPCESWSAARALGGIAGYTAGDGGPRALRTTEYPYGLPAMKVKEALQIQIANVLLTFSLMAMLCMATVGRMGVLEHPAPSDEAWIASTWKLQITRILTAHPAFRQYLIYQGVYGGHSPKPTTLLICADDHDEVAEILRFHAQTAMPQALRMGKDSSTGCFNTAKLKNYPPLLCKALAALAEGWGQRNFRMGVHGVSHEPFLAYVERLRRHFNESAAMGPDYAAWEFRLCLQRLDLPQSQKVIYLIIYIYIYI